MVKLKLVRHAFLAPFVTAYSSLQLLELLQDLRELTLYLYTALISKSRH
jgi:hypothetical protein